MIKCLLAVPSNEYTVTALCSIIVQSVSVTAQQDSSHVHTPHVFNARTQTSTSPNLYYLVTTNEECVLCNDFQIGQFCMSPGGTGSRKSQMSMVSSSEPLTIWKSSICRLLTQSECSCDKQVRIISQSWTGYTNEAYSRTWHSVQKDRYQAFPIMGPFEVHYTVRLAGFH